jgi:hypothetical protein
MGVVAGKWKGGREGKLEVVRFGKWAVVRSG